MGKLLLYTSYPVSTLARPSSETDSQWKCAKRIFTISQEYNITQSGVSVFPFQRNCLHPAAPKTKITERYSVTKKKKKEAICRYYIYTWVYLVRGCNWRQWFPVRSQSWFLRKSFLSWTIKTTKYSSVLVPA